MRVPKIKRPEFDRQDEAPKLHPAGQFAGKIIEMGTSRQSRSNGMLWVCPLTIETEHGKVYDHLHGTASTMFAILTMKEHFIGKDVSVKVRHREFDGRLYPDSYVVWSTAKPLEGVL